MSGRNKSIFNCPDLFEFQCPQSWATLEKTAQPDVRFCQLCKEHVHLCVSPEDFVRLGELGKCVAIPEEKTTSHIPGRYALGWCSKKSIEQMRDALSFWKSVINADPEFLKTYIAKNCDFPYEREDGKTEQQEKF